MIQTRGPERKAREKMMEMRGSRLDGWMHDWMDGWMDGWMDELVCAYKSVGTRIYKQQFF